MSRPVPLYVCFHGGILSNPKPCTPFPTDRKQRQEARAGVCQVAQLGSVWLKLALWALRGSLAFAKWRLEHVPSLSVPKCTCRQGVSQEVLAPVFVLSPLGDLSAALQADPLCWWAEGRLVDVNTAAPHGPRL